LCGPGGFTGAFQAFLERLVDTHSTIRPLNNRSLTQPRIRPKASAASADNRSSVRGCGDVNNMFTLRLRFVDQYSVHVKHAPQLSMKATLIIDPMFLYKWKPGGVPVEILYWCL
jgi:hypothetical protein